VNFFAVCFSDLCVGLLTRGPGRTKSVQGDYARQAHLSLSRLMDIITDFM